MARSLLLRENDILYRVESGRQCVQGAQRGVNLLIYPTQKICAIIYLILIVRSRAEISCCESTLQYFEWILVLTDVCIPFNQ